MQLRLFYILLAGAFFFLSCEDMSQKDFDQRLAAITKEVSFKDFKDEPPLHFVSTTLKYPGSIGQIAAVDSFLLLCDVQDTFLIHLIQPRQNREIKKFIYRGDSANQLLDVARVMVGKNNDFWLYDITQGKLLKLDHKTLFTDSTVFAQLEVLLSKPCRNIKSPCLVNDSVFVGCSYMFDDCRYLYFTKQSTIISKFGVIPPNPSSWPKENDSDAIKIATLGHPANCIRNNTLNSICVYYTTIPRVEIYRNDTLISVLKGPDHFKPRYKFKEVTLGNIPVNLEETKFAYMDAQTDDKFIYFVYSGRDNYQDCGQWLLVCDWTGKPIAKFKMAIDCCHFSILNIDGKKRLYMVNQDTGDLITAALDI